MVTLKNKNAILKINEVGAEMKSFTVDGVEYLWVGNPDIWSYSAPNCFPMTGGFVNDKYTYNSKEYSMVKHGFVKTMMFEVESCTENTAVFLLKSNDETKASYPFDFEFRVCYTLLEKAVSVDYKVTNASKDTMYFSVGSHDGFACPEGIEKYDLIFSEKETLDNYVLTNGASDDKVENICTNESVIPMNYDYFAIDSLVFKNVKSDSCKMINRETGRGIEISYKQTPYMVLWTKVGAPYLCIEPWFGTVPSADWNGDITKKEGIETVNCGETFVRTRVITAIEGK